MNSTENKIILDVCCGGRSFWFNKKHPLAIYCDIRDEDIECIYNESVHVHPDILCDFKNLPFKDNTFKLVIFDPPHLINKSRKMFMVQKYGTLPINWENELLKGFNECMRVLEQYGILIFKWNETEVETSKLIDLFGKQNLLIGHKSGKKMKTNWLVFMKINPLNKIKNNIFDFLIDKEK